MNATRENLRDAIRPRAAASPLHRLARACGRWCLLGAVGLVLAACTETRFESPPGDQLETCDARWKGTWDEIDADAGAKANREPAVEVDANCTLTLLDENKDGGAIKRQPVAAHFAHVDGNDVLVATDSAIKALVALDPPYGVDPTPKESYFLARYRVHGDRIDLYAVDSAHVAKLVIDGIVEGSVDKRRRELHVFVSGTRAQVLALMRNHAIFEGKPSLSLVRSVKTPSPHDTASHPPTEHRP